MTGIMKLLTVPSPLLRVKCLPVESITEDVMMTAYEMARTMYRHHGVGLAAPQVGSNLQIIVFDLGDKLYTAINPTLELSRGTNTEEESCLSLPGVRKRVKRSNMATMHAIDITGKPFLLEGHGLLARVMQHEVDHLNGILLLDK